MKKNRPPWESNINDEIIIRKPLKPIWAAEHVTLEKDLKIIKNKNNETDIIYPEKNTVKTIENEMVWKCSICDNEWYSSNPGRCPNCKTLYTATRPSIGLMNPLIAAMKMIEEGYDPKNG